MSIRCGPTSQQRQWMSGRNLSMMSVGDWRIWQWPGLIADLAVPYVAMHWRGHSAHMTSRARYENVVEDVVFELECRIESLVSSGVSSHQIVVDPGLGFAKTASQNWELLANLDRIAALGLPVLVRASRKSFLGALAGKFEGTTPAAAERDDLTCAVSALAASAGVHILRAHDA